MDRPLLALTLVLGAALAAYLMSEQASPSDKQSFLKKFAPIDEAISKAEGFPAGILSAWAAMESNWGTSKLTAASNNLFGIKAGPTWQKEQKPFVTMQTQENEGKSTQLFYPGAFRKYASWGESAQDLVTLLKSEGVYKGSLDALKTGNVPGFLAAIAASGYSTASNYGGRIANFMRDIAGIA